MGGRKNHNTANGDNQQTNSPKIINCYQFPIIGIDLGVSYWSAAIVQNGEVHVIPISGKNNMPAFVARLEDEFKFGNEAKNLFFLNREVTIFDMIYILGLRFNSGGELEEHMNDYSYTISNLGDKPKLSFTNNKPVFIEELLDIIINNLIYTSEIFLNKTIHNVVIPIPVYFKESQKSALLRATTHVGIAELISEPIAAIYAYRIHEKYKNDTKDRYFLIYNLQEDNLDVSVVQYANNKFTIKSNIYERHLKRNYTFRFLDELCTQTYETYCISNPRFHPLNSGTLRYYCKTIFEDILHADYFKIDMETIRDKKIVLTISRSELNDLLRVLVRESLILVKDVLGKANLETHNIDEVLLVGQLTRHAIVRQQLKYLLGQNSLNCNVNPEDVLVIGAALRADILQRKICENNQLAIPKSGTPSNTSYVSTDSVINTLCSISEKSTKYNSSRKKRMEQKDPKKNTTNYASSNIRVENVDRKLLHKQKFKQKQTKNHPIRKRKNKLSLRDKMLSMCTLFSNVVHESDLKMPVKEKLLFISSYLCRKLKCVEHPTKNAFRKLKGNYAKQQETTTEQCYEENCSKQKSNLITHLEVTKGLNFQESDLIFDANNPSKIKKKEMNLLKFCNLNYEYDAVNLLPYRVDEMHEEKTKWSLMDKVNCIQRHLDMFYVTICIAVFMLHWASENICINIAIALMSIAITLILNNRPSTHKMKMFQK